MWQVIGQTKAVTLLQHSLERGCLSHAYLFVGPPHVGKMTLAKNLAQAVNCKSEERPCGQCDSCRRIGTDKHADVSVIGLIPEEKAEGRLKTEIGIDQIRGIQASASLPPFEGRQKVFIIDEAEHLSSEASNCLLKTLEEPPPQVLLILLTAKERVLFPTILSRCQRVELRPLPLATVEQNLMELEKVSASEARLLARLSGGCIGWALSAARDSKLLEEHSERLASLLNLSGASREEGLAQAAHWAAQFSKNRELVQEMLALWLGWWRDLLLVKGGNSEFITNVDQEATLFRQAEDYSLRQIEGFIHCLQAAIEQLEQNANPRLVLEVLMLSLPQRGAE